jgi:hypothetical protein
MQNLVGLRKIECSSTKINSKERHSNTSRARRIVLLTFGVGSPDGRKCWLAPGVLTSSHLACAVTEDVGSPDVSRESRRSGVSTLARSPDVRPIGSLYWLLRWESRRTSGVPTVSSPDIDFCVVFLTLRDSVFYIRQQSRDLRQQSRRRSEQLDFYYEHK